ncbi:MAG: bifunctional pyr operon transcriptional regulator/uracil phosphoribosyltransferase PyrR [Flavobacteriales bacterium]|nr:bifunctional pyr operon transcriptional regulator/uracil phosphoribosyltransferase PyrR [Flavobacteriales bacterium]
MDSQVLIDNALFERVIDRLAHQLLEHHDFSQTDLIGLQPRGFILAERVKRRLQELIPSQAINCGALDVTFHRDDFRRREKPIAASSTHMSFLVENREIILIDDVLFTGRTIRAGLDALLAHGRPKTVQLLVLIDRRFQRELPIEPQFVGKSIDSLDMQYVQVDWGDQQSETRVLLHNHKPE